MRQSQISILALLAFLLAPLSAFAQTPCDGPMSTELFVLPPEAPGATYVFSYWTHDVPLLTQYTFRLYQVNAQGLPTGQPVTAQNVTKAATTARGVMQGDSTQTCFELPVVPVTQIPRGVPLVATLSATGGVQALSSLESEPSNPLGQRLGAPAIRVKP